jgi:hypothetical protein
LEDVWSFLEDGMPGLEADLESHSMEEGKSETSTTRKRERGWTKEDEVRRLEEKLELIRINMEELDMGSRFRGEYFANSRRISAGRVSRKFMISVEFLKNIRLIRKFGRNLYK